MWYKYVSMEGLGVGNCPLNKYVKVFIYEIKI